MGDVIYSSVHVAQTAQSAIYEGVDLYGTAQKARQCGMSLEITPCSFKLHDGSVTALRPDDEIRYLFGVPFVLSEAVPREELHVVTAKGRVVVKIEELSENNS